MSTDRPSTSAAPEPPSGEALPWPPPGLGRLQGDLWRVARRVGLAGGFLVLPLLFVIAREHELATLGPFADAWWVTAVLAAVGLAFTLDGLIRLARMLRRMASALDAGYDLATIAHVLADAHHDAGFLLQGARHFSATDARERGVIAWLRLTSVSLHVLAGLWLLVGLATGLLLAARDVVTHRSLWMGTLLPAVLMYGLGAAVGALAARRVKRARRAWHGQPWTADLVSEEIAAWRARRRGAAFPSPTAPRHRSLAPWLRGSVLLVGALAALIALPVVTLVPTSAVGPVLAVLGSPSFEGTLKRSAEVEAFRSYVLDPDPAISPAEAGQMLVDLMHVGTTRPVGHGEREPSRRFAEPWVPEETSDFGLMAGPPSEWADSIFTRVGSGLEPAERDFLERLAGHPARQRFSRLARAGALDVAVARWQSPLPPGLRLAVMPIPRVGSVRTAGHTHLGAAALELASGRPARAEEMVREVLSVGFLLGDHAPTVNTNLTGYFLVQSGARALEDFFRATGRAEEEAEIIRLARAADGAARRIFVHVPTGTEAYLRSLPAMVTDTSLMRGLRWELFGGVTTLAPCLNLHRMVFGPDEAYERFVASAHESLVDWPSEEALFAVARAGYMTAPSGTGSGWLGRIVGLSMRVGEGECGEIVRTLGAR